jgi:hypothetical protein
MPFAGAVGRGVADDDHRPRRRGCCHFDAAR